MQAAERQLAGRPADDSSEGQAPRRKGKASHIAAAKVWIAPQTAPSAITKPAEAELVVWLWRNWLAAGRLHLVVGPSDIGRSLLCCEVAARLSTGRKWPDRSQAATAGDVLIYAPDDDLVDSIRPRLAACRADLDRVHGIVSRPDPERALNDLDDLLRWHREVRLLIADPLEAFLPGNSSSRTWAALAAIAARHSVAVLGTCTKAADFSSAVDVVLTFRADSKSSDVVSVVQTKNGLTGAMPEPLSGRIVAGTLAPRLEWSVRRRDERSHA